MDDLKIWKSPLQMIGNTPIMEIKQFDNGSTIYAKLEGNNPSGSIKDRPALSMMRLCMAKPDEMPKSAVVASSGNFGVSCSFIGSCFGILTHVFMPENMSDERKKMILAYGGELIQTPAEKGMAGAVDMAKEFSEKIDGIYLDQFKSDLNWQAHETTTAYEIVTAFDNADIPLDTIVASVGSGGTIKGLQHGVVNPYVIGNVTNPKTWLPPHFYGVSAEIKNGKHGIQGITPNFIPQLFEKGKLYDGTIEVATDVAMCYARKLSVDYGLNVGISSGATYAGAVKVAKRNDGENILAVFPDSGTKYFSTDLYNYEV